MDNNPGDQLGSAECVRSNTKFHYFGYVVIVLGGLAMGTMLMLRLIITVAMVGMVNRTAIYMREHPEEQASDYFADDYGESGEFDWSNEVQQTIITGYMIAYTLPQFFTTRLSMRYGFRVAIPICLATCSLSNIFTPIVAYWGWQWVLVMRLLNGLGASAIMPNMINAIENWMPQSSTAMGIAIFQFSSNIVYAMTPLVSGLLASISWKLAFHVPGGIALIFCLLWWALVADNPELSSLVSQKELDRINGITETPSQKGQQKGDEKSNRAGKAKVVQRSDVPWFFMFKISSFYSLSMVWILYCTSIGGLFYLLPNYMNRVLHVPVEEIGVLNFATNLGTMFCMLWPHPFTGFLQKQFNWTLSTARKFVVSLTMVVVMATFSYLAVYHDHLVLTISINRFFHMTNDTIFMATVMSQFGKSGLSGLIYSMINTIGCLSIVFYCWVVGRLLDYTGESLECWSWIIWSMAAMCFAHLLIYSFSCHSEPVDVKLPKKQLEDGLESDNKDCKSSS